MSEDPPPNGGDDDGDGERFPKLPEGLWNRLRADPAHAPQHLALAAIERWGEQARDHAQQVRAEFPEASPRELAGIVKTRHVLLARMEGAAAGVPGSVMPIVGAVVSILPDVTTLAWIQSRMVIHIAAVYGHDTTDPETAAELLVLQGFYNSTEAARIAIVEATKRVATRLAKLYLKGGTLLLLKQMFRTAGIPFSRAGVLRAIPYVSIPVSAVVNEVATRSLGNRAIKFYDLNPRAKP